MGKRNRKKRKQRSNRSMWQWPNQITEKIATRAKKKKEKKPKVRWIRDPSIPDKFQRIASLGKTLVGVRSKDGTVEYFQIDPTNK